MAIHRIPTSLSLVSYTQRTALDGRDYLLTFRWNQRESKWYLDIRDQDAVDIVLGIKIVVNKPLLGTLVTGEARPPGDIIATDLTTVPDDGKVAYDPGRNELGGRVVLLYFDEDEVAGL